MKPAIFIGIPLLLLFFCGNIFGNGVISIGSYTLPIVETEALFSRWLRQENYSVTSKDLANGEVVLQGITAGKQVKVLLRPHSSLGTDIDLLEASSMEGVSALRKSWESFLARSGQTRGIEIPEPVRSLADAVVCISAPPADSKKINFTGFLIDQRGTVLTIAHDFDELRDFKLSFSGEGGVEGRVVKSNAAKDLSIIESNYRGNNRFFSLKEGRTRLNLGDRIFMLCCSSTGSVQIQSGTVDKPKATVSGQTLLQVKLEQVFFGSSGSPVVDANGRLVGVVKGRFRGTNSRGFLVPLDTVRSFVGLGKK